MHKSPYIDCQQLLITTLQAAKEAGETILEIYNSDFSVEHKEDKTPLTLADRRSHEIISNRLKDSTISLRDKKGVIEFPVPVLSEEGEAIHYSERKRWNFFWLVDPLDGTREFVKRNGEFTVNIALMQGEKPVLGLIYIPVRNTYYFSAAGLGAYKLSDSEVFKCSDKEILFDRVLRRSATLPAPRTGRHLNEWEIRTGKSMLTIVGSRSHASSELQEFIKERQREYGEVKFISAGSSLKFCLIAEGRADIYPRFSPTMEWDTAAGQAIVEGSGGRILNTESGETLKYNKENLRNQHFIAEGALSPYRYNENF
jgi:3'(2'), 5'-bisphosphate nucleotidase